MSLLNHSHDSYDALLNDDNDDYLLALSLQVIENDCENVDQTHTNSDRQLALQLAQQLNGDNGYNGDIGDSDHNHLNIHTNTRWKHKNISIISPQLETLDPNPNIWHLMREFDDRFFGGILSTHCIELSWSPRMTRTAGICGWNANTNYCSIRLSQPLLLLRSRRDLVETLLHEMIHALLFVTKKDDNHESHGPLFHEHMYRINKESGTNITVYHGFHEEVNHYLTHVWRCEGICRDRSPYYGYVRRAMNRNPSPNDYWFKYHEQTCGGKFIKISEPTVKSKRAKNNKTEDQRVPKNHDIRSYFSPEKKTRQISDRNKLISFSGIGMKLGSLLYESISSSTSRKTTTIELANPEELNISDIREYFNLQKASRDVNNIDMSMKLIRNDCVTESGVNIESSTSQYPVNLVNSQFKPINNTFDCHKSDVCCTDKQALSTGISNSSERDISYFIPFTGKAYRLGNIEKDNESLNKKNINLISNENVNILPNSCHQHSNIKNYFKKFKKIDDKDVIELD